MLAPQPDAAHVLGAIEGSQHELGSAGHNSTAEHSHQQAAPMDVDTPPAAPDSAGGDAVHHGQSSEVAILAEEAVRPPEEIQLIAAPWQAQALPDEVQQGEVPPHGTEQHIAEGSTPANHIVEPVQLQQGESKEQGAGVLVAASTPMLAEQQQAADAGTPAEYAAQPLPLEQAQTNEQEAGPPAPTSTPPPTKVLVLLNKKPDSFGCHCEAVWTLLGHHPGKQQVRALLGSTC